MPGCAPTAKGRTWSVRVLFGLRIRLWTYSLLSRPEAQRVGRAMVAAVPVERGWHLVMGGRRVRHCLVNLDTNENEETPSD
jgi:hypothetical protein